jgi:nucleotide-binding universal stress UspA family protein
MVVVGIDGSEESKAALALALEEARLRGTTLQVIYAWTMPAPAGRMGYYATELQDPGPYQEGAERFLADFLEEAAGDTGGVEVEAKAVQASPGTALVEASEGADLLVVGSRGHGGFASLVLGSVSTQAAQHASCPVVIVR